MANDLLTRRADLTPASLRRDGDSVTVDAIITTGSPVQRRGYVERLAVTRDAVTLTESVPLRDNHNSHSIRDILGRAHSFRFEPGQIVATLEINDPAAAALVERGDVSAVSIGYREIKRTETRKGGELVRTLTGWRLAEVSLTDNPADPAATIRSEDEMPKDQNQGETDQRSALIEMLAGRYRLPGDFQTRAANLSLGEIMALADDEGEEIQPEPAPKKRSAPVIRTTTPQNDDPQVIVTRAADAMAYRMGAGELPPASREYANMSMLDMAKDSLLRSGVSVRGMSADEVLQRSAHGTSDFPLVVAS